MGQLLIVQGEDPVEVSSLFRRGVAASAALNGRRVLDSLEAPGLGVAVFGRPVAATGIVRRSAPPSWICGAGAWFYEGRAGAEGLERLATAPRQDLARWLRAADGAFAIVLEGGRAGELLAVTDRLGTLHLYKAHSGSAVLLATSSLVLAAVLEPGWDPAGLRYFLATGSVFERHSLFARIEKLPPATVFPFEGGRAVAERKYWSVAEACYDQAAVRGDVPGLADGLRRAMAAIGANSPNAILDLTGGYDSRALAGAMLQEGLCFHTIVNGDAGSPDVATAGRIAAEFSIPHERRDRGPAAPEAYWKRAVETVPMTDGECDALLQAPVLETHSFSASRFGASINGSNGEICKGQWWEMLLPHVGKRGHFDARRVAAARFAYGATAAPLLAYQFEDDLVEAFAGAIRRATAGMERHPNTALVDCVYLTLRMQRWQGRIMSASAQLWPVYSPFAFREPMEMALAAPVGLRVRHRMSRRLIEHQNPALAALPLAQGYPALPLRWNTVQHFGPLAAETIQTVWRGLLRRAGLRARRDSFDSYPLARIAHIEEVRELLRPAQMASADAYDRGRLNTFLEVDLATAPLPERYGRVLTVELAARAVRAAAAAAREPAE